MRYTIFLLCLCSLLVTSCKKRTDFEKMLIANQWVLNSREAPDSINTCFGFYMVFDKDGTDKTFYIDSDKEYSSFYCGMTKLAPEEWSFNEEDSILIFNKIPLKLLSVTPDTILMERLDYGWKLNFINKAYFNRKGKFVK
ncbi:hypothetical protein NU09_1156 [Flavobacterium beibuense]|uniref:Lipoprotein n=2 Tax=Flavobacterium beibuense TaxID=657326 RepID=A0A444WFJ5_9FLAO|nr:hypothetical protein NU09_1156 [Flavobacterium beibuense]